MNQLPSDLAKNSGKGGREGEGEGGGGGGGWGIGGGTVGRGGEMSGQG